MSKPFEPFVMLRDRIENSGHCAWSYATPWDPDPWFAYLCSQCKHLAAEYSC